MKLTNTSIETLSTGHTGGSAVVTGAGEGESRSAKTTSSDSVNLSSASQQLLSLAKASASDRAVKLASVASLVRSGQYSADTASVSRAVVQGHIQ